MTTPETDALLRACRAYGGGAPSAELRASTAAFLARAAKEPALLTAATDALASLPPPGAAWLAVTFGTSIETGSDPALTGPFVWKTFTDWLDTLAPSVPPAQPSLVGLDREQWLASLPLLAQSVVAHLARLPALRAKLGEDAALIARLHALTNDSFAALWVAEALERSSASLVVLHPTTATGALLRYENVSRCFHLFSLIQEAVGEKLSGGIVPHRSVLAALHGEPDGAEGDHATWHYADPRVNSPQIGASIWGEASVREIPSIEGQQVILLWPKLLGSRGWGSSFFGPMLDALPASVVYERALEPAEVRAWLDKLGIAG
jgi:hypothetical protein